MEKTKHALGPLPVIDPYVTTNGGVVILNGPFPIDQAHRIAKLCKVAPDLLEARRAALKFIAELWFPLSFKVNEQTAIEEKLEAVIAKAEGQE